MALTLDGDVSTLSASILVKPPLIPAELLEFRLWLTHFCPGLWVSACTRCPEDRQNFPVYAQSSCPLAPGLRYCLGTLLRVCGFLLQGLRDPLEFRTLE